MTESQVDDRLQRAHRAGYLLTTTTKDRDDWTLHITYPRPAVDAVINHHQDAVIIKAKTWEEAIKMVLENPK